MNERTSGTGSPRDDRRRVPGSGVPFRRFELTIGVYLTADEPLPDTFNQWIVRAFGIDPDELCASPTTLERVVETRYPLSDDVIEKRGNREGPWS